MLNEKLLNLIYEYSDIYRSQYNKVMDEIYYKGLFSFNYDDVMYKNDLICLMHLLKKGIIKNKIYNYDNIGFFNIVESETEKYCMIMNGEEFVILFSYEYYNLYDHLVDCVEGLDEWDELDKYYNNEITTTNLFNKYYDTLCDYVFKFNRDFYEDYDKVDTLKIDDHNIIKIGYNFENKKISNVEALNIVMYGF